MPKKTTTPAKKTHKTAVKKPKASRLGKGLSSLMGLPVSVPTHPDAPRTTQPKNDPASSPGHDVIPHATEPQDLAAHGSTEAVRPKGQKRTKDSAPNPSKIVETPSKASSNPADHASDPGRSNGATPSTAPSDRLVPSSSGPSMLTQEKIDYNAPQSSQLLADPQTKRTKDTTDTANLNDTSNLRYIAVDVISMNPHQPREDFDPDALKSLADSIRTAGVMQPILVRESSITSDGLITYELVAGERRWRAAQMAGLNTIPAIAQDLTDEQVAEWSLIENIQRKDLNPIERARAFARLMDQFNLTHTQIAERVSLQRSSVTNALRLLELAPPVQELVRMNKLSAGHARAIAGVARVEQQIELARRAIAQNLSVRQIETLARYTQDPTRAPVHSGLRNPDPNLADLEDRIGQALQTKALIRRGRKKGTGTLTIEFYSLDHFDSLMKRLNISTDDA